MSTIPDYVQSAAGECLEQLSACTILQLVAQNPSARNLPLTWHFVEEESEEWATRDQFVRPVDRDNRFLIVTEGSSDAHVLRHAFRLLKPHIADFFDFVDMDEGYPFTGTGNLYNFTKGLISISVLNNIVVLYDNDAEGVFNFKRTLELNVPANMRVLKLPNLPEFRQASAQLGQPGNTEQTSTTAQRRLSVTWTLGQDASVRWTTFNKGLGAYHGVLVDKTDAVKTFLSHVQRRRELRFRQDHSSSRSDCLRMHGHEREGLSTRG